MTPDMNTAMKHLETLQAWVAAGCPPHLVRNTPPGPQPFVTTETGLPDPVMVFNNPLCSGSAGGSPTPRQSDFESDEPPMTWGDVRKPFDGRTRLADAQAKELEKRRQQIAAEGTTTNSGNYLPDPVMSFPNPLQNVSSQQHAQQRPDDVEPVVGNGLPDAPKMVFENPLRRRRK